MARSSDEKDILGEATNEELEVFEKEKKFDESVKIEVDEAKKENSNKVEEAISEEALRIKREGDKEIEKVNEEISKFIEKEEELKKRKAENPEEFAENVEEDNKKKYKGLTKKISNKIITTHKSIEAKSFNEKLDIVKSLLVILLTLLTVTLAFVTVLNHRKVVESRTLIKLDIPKSSEYVTNILVNESIDFFGKDINLGRITFDEENTVFYFDSPIDFEGDYRATLLDNSSRYYAMNTHYMKNIPESNEGKVAAFAPIPNGTRQFKLEIIDNRTSEKIIYYFKFNKRLMKEKTFEVYSTTRENDEKVKFENVVASESGTTINYSLIWPQNAKYYFGVDNYGNGSATLTHNLTTIPLKTGELVSYVFDDYNLLLLEGNYSTLKSYEGILKLVMNNVYKIYDINRVYNTKEILLNEANIEIQLDEYTLVLERMRKSDDMAVLVYHIANNDYEEIIVEEQSEEIEETEMANDDISVNKQIYYEEPYNTPTLKGILDVEIIVTSGVNKGDVIKPFDMKIADIGGDVQFVDDRLMGLTSRDFEVRINKVKINDSKYIAEINLDYINKYGVEDDYVKKAIDDIKKSFLKRLAFKSGELTKSKITGFNKSILLSKEFNEYYSPQDLEKRAYYGISIVSFAVTDNIIHAIVMEEWRGEKEEEFIYANNRHEIVYDVKQELIIYDKIR